MGLEEARKPSLEEVMTAQRERIIVLGRGDGMSKGLGASGSLEFSDLEGPPHGWESQSKGK